MLGRSGVSSHDFSTQEAAELQERTMKFKSEYEALKSEVYRSCYIISIVLLYYIYAIHILEVPIYLTSIYSHLHCIQTAF